MENQYTIERDGDVYSFYETRHITGDNWVTVPVKRLAKKKTFQGTRKELQEAIDLKARKQAEFNLVISDIEKQIEEKEKLLSLMQ